MEGFGALCHGSRKARSAERRLATRDGPVFNPATPFFAYIRIRQPVGVIAERFFESNEAITPLAHETEQVADMFGFQIICMKQEDLTGLIAEKIFRELFVIVEDSGVIGKIGSHHFPLQSRVT